MKKIIPYGRQNITEADIEAVTNTLKSSYLTTGPKVKEFEDKFAEYVGAKYAVAVSNGTAALHLSALSLGITKGSKVITTPITFSATANSVKYCGGQVYFCDINPENFLLDISKVRARLEAAPKGTYQGIIPVDFAGYPVDLEALRALADEFGLWIIEDACHAPGGWFTNRQGEKHMCGNGKYADISIFSFHPVKHIACGEGGMITTNNLELYEKLLQLRSHGMIYQGNSDLIENHGKWYMELHDLGYNYRIPDILCSLGISQLSRATDGLKQRKKIADKYNKAFEGTNIKINIPPSDIGHAYHLYVIQVENRKELYNLLRNDGIFAQVHYVPVHTMPYYQNLQAEKISMPLAENYYEKCLSLPMFPTLTEKEHDFVIEKVLTYAS